MQNRIKINLWLSRIGLGLIFCYCFAASIFYAPFAQLHLTLPGLPFPIFIGEILLIICLILFLCIPKDKQLFDKQSLILLGLYFGWLLAKALIDFYLDGPLTARNAALFYYPIFAVFAYSFYRKALISRSLLICLGFVAAVILLFKAMFLYYWWTYVSVFFIVICNIKSTKWRWIAWVFLGIILLLAKEFIFKGTRSHFVSVFGAVVFLVIYLGNIFFKLHRYAALKILTAIFLLYIAGVFIFSNHNDTKSITSVKTMVKSYQDFDKVYQLYKINYVPQDLKVHLYNYKKFNNTLVRSPSPHSSSAKTVIGQSPSVNAKQGNTVSTVGHTTVDGGHVIQDWLNNIKTNRSYEERSMGLNEDNIVFRLFVWRDMACELIEKQAWYGFSFGHPQRSKSLETLHWAESEWSRDGWITPHNSFFHVIYRSGVIGLCLIIVLIYMMCSLIGDFFKLNSIEGGFLIGALIYWMIVSNFLVILEFPYNAILFWSLFGITWGYRDDLKEKSIRQK